MKILDHEHDEAATRQQLQGRENLVLDTLERRCRRTLAHHLELIAGNPCRQLGNPGRRGLPQRRDRLRPARPTAQILERFEDRHVRFAFTVNLHALPASHCDIALGSDRSGEAIDHRSLTDAGLAGNQDQLPAAAARGGETAPQAIERLVAPDHRRRRDARRMADLWHS